MTDSNTFSRERAAGWDPDVLAKGVVVVVGCGAGANNLVQTLMLCGLGEIRLIDYDTVASHNLSRSPLFRRHRMQSRRKRYKAAECAASALEIASAADPIVRYAIERIETLGYGAFDGAHVIVAAVDSLPVRAYLSDVARLLGLAFVEGGFSGSFGHVSVFPVVTHRNDAACWRCYVPHVQHGGIGCSLYASAAEAAGFIPATQPMAATIANIMAAHVVEALHGRVPLAGHAVQVDLLGGRMRPVEVSRDPSCPGAHRGFGPVRQVEASSNGTVAELFAAARPIARDPILHLPGPFVLEAPCARCGAPVSVERPGWAIASAPSCRACPEVPQLGGAGVTSVSTIETVDELAKRKLRQFEIAPGAILEISDRASGTRTAVKLSGGVDDLYETLRRESRNARAARRTEEVGAKDAPNKETPRGEQATDEADLHPPPRRP